MEENTVDVEKLNQPIIDVSVGEQFEGLTADVLDLSQQLAQEGAFRAQAEEEAGVGQAEQDVVRFSNQLREQQAQQQAIPLQLQEEFTGRGVTAGGVAPIQAGRLRQNAIKQLSTGAALQAAQGNLQLAQSTADRAVRLEFEPKKADLQAKLIQLDALSPILEAQEKTRAEELKRQYEKDQLALEKQQKEREEINKIMALAAESGANQDTLLSILQARSVGDAIVRAGGVLGAEAAREVEQIRFENQIKLAQLELSEAKMSQDWDMFVSRLQLDKEKFNDTVAARVRAKFEEERKKGEQAGMEEEAAVEQALGLTQLVEELLEHPGMDNAVGQNIFARTERGGLVGKYFSGADEDFIAKAERLKNLLTIENLDLMSGVLSETDIKILSGAATTLQFDMAEKDFISELNRIKAVSQRLVNEKGVTPEQAQFYYGFDSEEAQEFKEIWGDDAFKTSGEQEFNAANYY